MINVEREYMMKSRTREKIQRIKEDNQIEDQMKEDHFGINVEREYKINHGHKANQTRMSEINGNQRKTI